MSRWNTGLKSRHGLLSVTIQTMAEFMRPPYSTWNSLCTNQHTLKA